MVIEDDNVCCDTLFEMNIRWMRLEDGTLVLPHLDGLDGKTKYKVIFCPSCGKDITGIQVKTYEENEG